MAVAPVPVAPIPRAFTSRAVPVTLTYTGDVPCLCRFHGAEKRGKHTYIHHPRFQAVSSHAFTTRSHVLVGTPIVSSTPTLPTPGKPH
jgi:hypothetical protein